MVASKPALRQSMIKQWYYCKAAYYASYILGVPLGLGEIALDYGTAFHKEVENYHNGQPYDKELLAGYTAVVPIKAQVEVSFEFRPRYKGDEFPVLLTGTIDRISDIELSDFKTSSVSYSQAKVDAPLGIQSSWGFDGTGLQATMYLYYWWHTTGKLLPFSFIVYRKDKPNWEPARRIQIVTTTRTLEDFDNFWLFAFKTWEDIQLERDFKCSCKNKEHLIWEP